MRSARCCWIPPASFLRCVLRGCRCIGFGALSFHTISASFLLNTLTAGQGWGELDESRSSGVIRTALNALRDATSLLDASSPPRNEKMQRLSFTNGTGSFVILLADSYIHVIRKNSQESDES